jgi:hypothetical protein
MPVGSARGSAPALGGFALLAGLGGQQRPALVRPRAHVGAPRDITLNDCTARLGGF